jgi:hypothetical protein
MLSDEIEMPYHFPGILPNFMMQDPTDTPSSSRPLSVSVWRLPNGKIDMYAAPYLFRDKDPSEGVFLGFTTIILED